LRFNQIRNYVAEKDLAPADGIEEVEDHLIDV
jgi:hypothetical protein